MMAVHWMRDRPMPPPHPRWWSNFPESQLHACVDVDIDLDHVEPIVSGYKHQPDLITGHCPCAMCFDRRTEQRHREEQRTREARRAWEAELARVEEQRRLDELEAQRRAPVQIPVLVTLEVILWGPR